MIVNHVPKLSKDNPTLCCPRFNPSDWDGKTFQFKNKPFVRMTTRSFFYMPLNLGTQMKRTRASIMAAKADTDEFIAMSYDLSPWQAEHFLAVTKTVPDQENVKITGKFRAKVFEGPYQDAPQWIKSMNTKNKVYLYYTTCPKCQKVYDKNYVVAMAKV